MRTKRRHNDVAFPKRLSFVRVTDVSVWISFFIIEIDGCLFWIFFHHDPSHAHAHDSHSSDISLLFSDTYSSTTMKTTVYLLLTAAVMTTSVSAYGVTPSRRAFVQAAVTSTAAVATAIVLPTQAALALEACPKKSSNCILTTWTPPAGTSKAAMADTVKSVLESYPAAGQNGVDLGGWELVEDNFKTAGTARVEYKSGIGNFAKFLNGGKPFVDDLSVEIGDAAVVLKSSSRIGESDLDVNRKRLVYLVDAIKGKGWEAPEPKY